jgi:beta-lactamase regulating signal transducer with metallopeptidase domain
MSHTLDAIAWTLIHFCWQAAAIAGIYRLSTVLLARSTSQTRYLIAVAAMLMMVGAAVGTFAWQMRWATSSPAPHNAASTIEDASLALPRTMAPGFISQHQGVAGSTQANLLRWIDGFWVLGVVVLSVRSLGGWWMIQRLRATAIADAPEQVRESFRRIFAAMGLRRPVLLRVSSAVAGPITVGALRAMVLLPLSAITLLGPDELEMVLAHELAHVRRADFLCNLAQTFVETLFFFHPAVWWIGNRVRHERELCCDDLALKICPNPVTYATALFRLEEQRARHWRLAMALDGHQTPQTLRLRIARILGEPVARSGGRPVQPFSLIVACVALAVSLTAARPVVASLNPAHLSASTHIASIQVSATPQVKVIKPALAAATHLVSPGALLEAAASEPREKQLDAAQPRASYIDRMKAAGYDVDLDKFIAMKIQDVTPEYAQAMAQSGFGKPSADELIACKIHGVTPDYISSLRQQGFQLKSFQDAISFRIFEVTPEFVAGMKSAGFSDLTSQQLVALRVQGVTPEYAQQIAREYPGATVEDLIKTRIFRIDASFIESAKKHGFTHLSLEKLVQLRITGLLDDESVKQ